MIYKAQMNRLVAVQREESIEAPEALIKLVKSNDKQWGRNGHHWMGCERGKGKTIDRLQSYLLRYRQSIFYRNGSDHFPIQLDDKGMNETRHWDEFLLPSM